MANPHLDLINSTPCLLSYRSWFYTDIRQRTPEFDPATSGATAEQCAEAKVIHERIIEEQADEARRFETEQEAKRQAALAQHERERQRALRQHQARLAQEARNDREREAQRRAYEVYRDELARRPDVRIGMKANDVLHRSNWGVPDDVRRTTSIHGTTELWFYRRGTLYLENGVVTVIRD
jgi:hypothetical protein